MHRLWELTQSYSFGKPHIRAGSISLEKPAEITCSPGPGWCADLRCYFCYPLVVPGGQLYSSTVFSTPKCGSSKTRTGPPHLKYFYELGNTNAALGRVVLLGAAACSMSLTFLKSLFLVPCTPYSLCLLVSPSSSQSFSMWIWELKDGWGLSQEYLLIASCALSELLQQIIVLGCVHTIAYLSPLSDVAHPDISNDLTAEHLPWLHISLWWSWWLVGFPRLRDRVTAPLGAP